MKDLACVIFEGYHQWQSKFNTFVLTAGIVGAAMLLSNRAKIRSINSENEKLRTRVAAIESHIQNSKS